MPVVGLAEVLVTPSFKGSQRTISREFGPAAQRAGRDAGASLGQGMAEGLAGETAELEAEASRAARSVAQAEEKISTSRERAAKASAAESKVLGDLRVAELKLQETRDNSKAKASQVAAAEERVNVTRARAAAATRQREEADRSLASATDNLTRSSRSSAEANSNLERHLARVTTESARAEHGLGRLGIRLRSAFNGRPLAGTAASINGDSVRIRRDMTQLSQDVARAGTKGGKGFTQGFIKIVGGLSAVTPAAGAAGAAALGAVGGVLALSSALKTLGGAAALAPAGMLAIGGAIGVMATAFHGMGEALSTATDASKTATSNARLDAMALEDAARQISDAEQRAGEVQVESAKKVADAKKDLRTVVAQNAEQQAAALRRVVDAEKNVERANRTSRQAQLDLNQARADAVMRIKDLNRSLEQAGLSERDAALRYEEALASYNLGVSIGGDPTSKTMRQLKLDLDQAAFGLRAAQEETVSLRQEQEQAAKDGVDGNKQVQSAEQALADAREAATESVRDREDAVREVAKVEAESADSIIEAQEAIAEATQEASSAQVDAARSVSDAYRNMERIQIQQADTAAAAGADAALAMAALTPAAQTAVRALLSVYEQLGTIRRIAQEAFFTGFAAPLLNLASVIMPQLATGVAAMATVMGAGAQQLMNSLSTGLGGGVLEKMLFTLADSIGIMNRAVDPLVQSFITLGVVGMDYMPRMATAISDMATRFNTFIQDAAVSGELNTWIDNGIQGFKDLFSIVGSVSGILGGLSAAAAAGGITSTLGGMADALDRVEAAINGPVFQSTMGTIFAGAAAGSAGLAAGLRAVGDAFVVGAPALAEFMRLGGEISGTFIGGIADALSNPAFGAGLVSFLESVQRGVQQVAPLLPGLTTAFGSILTSMGPIVENLGPSMVTVFTAFATAAAGVLEFLSPMLAMIADSPATLGFFIVAFGATAVAVKALTFAGNLQKIAMASWAVASGVVKAALFLLRGAWITTGLAAIKSGAETAAIWLMYRLDSAKAAAAHVANAARIVGGWVLMGAQALIQGARIAAGWVLAMGPIGLLIAAVSAITAGFVWFFTQTEVGQKMVQVAWGGIKTAVSAVSDWFQNTLVPAITTAFSAIGAVFTWLYETIIKPVFDAIGAVFSWLYDNVVQPYFAQIKWAFESLGILIDGVIQVVVAVFREILIPIFSALWETVKSVFAGIGETLATWWDNTVLIFDLVVGFLRDTLGAAFTWLKDNIIDPVFNGIAWAISTWWAGAQIIFNAVVGFVRDTLGGAFTWLKDSVIDPVFNGIKWLITTWWTGAQIIFNAVVTFLRDTVGGAFQNFWTVVQIIFNAVKEHIRSTWEDKIKPVFDTLAKFVREDIPAAFEAAKDGIGRAWDKIKDLAKKPVEFVVNRVINEGLIDTFNKIPGVDIKHVSLPPGFKKGGYTGDLREDEVAGVVHGREFVMNAKATAAIGKDKLAAMARNATHGAAATVGAGNMGGFFTGNTGNIRKHGAYYLNVAPSMAPWNFRGAAKMWDGAAGIKVAIGNGQAQGYATPKERGGGILGYAMGNNIDMSPQWMNTLNAVQRQTVAAHEMGHAMGLPHNSGHSIMQPNLAQMAKGPTIQDIVNLQSLYPGGSGKAGSPSPENPFTGLIDTLMGKFKAAFPGGGMMVDAVGGLAKNGIDKVTQWIQDIKDGVKNVAGDVVNSVRGFFGGGAAMASSQGPAPLFRDQGGILPPGLNQVLNATGGNEYVLNRRQWNDIHSLATRHAPSTAGTEVNFHGPVYGNPQHIVDEMDTRQRRTASLNNLRKVVMS